MKKFDITAFGEILIDFTYMGNAPDGQKLFAQNAGGAPANVLVCATKFGLNTAFLGKIGKDIHGDFLRLTLEKQNVNTQGLIIDETHFTTLAFVDLNENGERSFSFARNHGADTFMTKEDINLEILAQSKIFHVGSLSLTTALGKETTNFAIQKAKDAGAYISYDPNYRASLWQNEAAAQKEMQEIIPFADFMKISDEECQLLTKENDPNMAAQTLNDAGVKIVCVTLGENGALVSTKDGQMVVAGFKSTKVIDTTGAGDSFWGGFLSQIIKNMDLKNDLKNSNLEHSDLKNFDIKNFDIANFTIDELAQFTKIANATASLCVEKNGAINAMPTQTEITQRLNTK